MFNFGLSVKDFAAYPRWYAQVISTKEIIIG